MPIVLALDCQIVLEDPSGFTLSCRVNIGEGGKWVKGPRPVLTTTNAPKRKAQGRHRRAHHKAR